MELKDRLRAILKERYGIETDKELLEALDEQPALDFGIFVNNAKGEIKSA